MSDHLTQDQTDRYRRRMSPAAELIEVDRHIARCAECRERLAKECRLDTRASVSTHAGQSEHLSEEELDACVDGMLAPEQRERLLAHVGSCLLCAGEVRDLQEFKNELETHARPRRARLALTAAAAFVTFTLVISHLARRPPAHDLAALNASTRQVVLESIERGTIPLPNVLTPLRGGRETLRGSPDPHGESSPLEPQGEVLPDPQPVFRWQRLPQATSYSVAVFDTDSHPVQNSPSLSDPQWKPGTALERGRIYQWQLTATMRDGTLLTLPAPPAPEARFAVASESEVDELRNFRQLHPDEHLVLGVLYIRAGMLTPGQIELHRIKASDPRYGTAQKLLSSLSASLQSGSPASTNPAQ